MIIRIPCTQVPEMWEVIKFAAVNSDMVEDRYLQKYCNDLLIDLLSSKKHAMVLLDEDRVIKLLMILSFKFNNITGKKSLCMSNLYGWKKTTDKEKLSGLVAIRKFAKETECDFLETNLSNPKLYDLAIMAEPVQEIRQYVFNV